VPPKQRKREQGLVLLGAKEKNTGKRNKMTYLSQKKKAIKKQQKKTKKKHGK
jgi:hypothetical protein